ncbi:MAG: folate family ECF transporter S component [Ruminiclostridium sp.]|nr:folate family ECF transporter S component [Ruminiclostridium sp.]
MSFFEKFGRSAMELKSLRCITVTGILIALDIVLKMFSITVTKDLKITFAFIALAAIGMLFGPTVGFLAGVITDVIGYLIRPEGGFSPLFTFVEAFGAMLYGLFLYDLSIKAVPDDSIAEKKKDSIGSSLLRGFIIGAIVGAAMAGIMLLLSVIMSPYKEDAGIAGKIAAVLTNSAIIWVAAVVGVAYGLIFTFIIRMTNSSGAALRAVLAKVSVVVVCNLFMTPAAMVISGYMTWESLIANYPVRIVKNAVQCPVDCIILVIMLVPIRAAYKKIMVRRTTG